MFGRRLKPCYLIGIALQYPNSLRKRQVIGPVHILYVFKPANVLIDLHRTATLLHVERGDRQYRMRIPTSVNELPTRTFPTNHCPVKDYVTSHTMHQCHEMDHLDGERI